ncbi:hypothetical protein CRC_03047 [Cylindrospermopsis raciborskii CS-505]|nr:hypothetical protein CRC_03047 [Cylindrospermopsis raciborskii CS-505]
MPLRELLELDVLYKRGTVKLAPGVALSLLDVLVIC